MRIILFLLSVLAFLAGAGILVAAQGAIHEIEGFVLFLISAVLLIGASVVDAVHVARKRLEQVVQSVADTTKTTADTIRALREQLTSSSPKVAPPAPRPVPNTKLAARQAYFFSQDGADSGPHSLDEMRQFRQTGSINDETLTFREGDSQWRPLSQFAEISS